jgi:hypothetical protein
VDRHPFDTDPDPDSNFHVDADPDPDPDPDWHQNDADPHVYTTPSFTHVVSHSFANYNISSFSTVSKISKKLKYFG